MVQKDTGNVAEIPVCLLYRVNTASQEGEMLCWTGLFVLKEHFLLNVKAVTFVCHSKPILSEYVQFVSNSNMYVLSTEPFMLSALPEMITLTMSISSEYRHKVKYTKVKSVLSEQFI